MRAIIYCRTSSDDESGDDKSIPEQAADCIRLCKDQGYTLITEPIKEPNRSGRLYPEGEPLAELDEAVRDHSANMQHKSRPGLAKVVRLLSQADVIVIRDNERLARPLSDSFLAAYLTQKLTKAKIKIHSVLDGLKDPAEWETQFVGAIRSMATDRETRKRAALSKAKKQKLQDAGMARTCRFFGYRNVGKKVEVIQEQADVVRKIFRWILEGINLAEIVRRLQELDPLHSWTRSIVRILVDKPQYAGKCADSKGRLIDSVVYPAIVTFSEWKRVQEWRQKNKAKIGRPTIVPGGHPLTGLVYCGYCGAKMQIHVGSSWGKEVIHRYRCPNVTFGKKCDCSTALVSERRLIGFARAFVPLAAQFIPMPEPESKRQERRTTLEQRRAELLKKEDALVDAADINADTVKRQLARIAEEMKKVDDALAGLEQKSTITLMQEISPALTSLLTSSILSGKGLRLALENAFKSLVVFKNKITVTLRNGSSFEVPRVPLTSQRIPPIACMESLGREMFPYRILLPMQSCLSGRQAMPKGIIVPFGIKELQNLDGARTSVYRDKNIEVLTVGEQRKVF